MSESLLGLGFQSVYYQAMVKILEKYLEKSISTQKVKNPTRPLEGDFVNLIKQAAERYQVDPHLVQAVVKAESNFDPDVVSSAGAQGLMQLMPQTAADLGVVDPFDPQQNIEGGTRFLSQLLTYFDGDTTKALAGYNAGPGAVDEYDGIPPYKETQTYVNRVLDYYNQSKYNWSA